MEIKIHKTAGGFLTRIYKNEIQILLLYKCWPGKLEGWMPPKGHVEEGEDLIAAALRETSEETGFCNLENKGFMKTINIEYPWDDECLHKKEIHWFHLRLKNNIKKRRVYTNDEKKSTKVQKWFALDQAIEKMKFDDEKEVLFILIKKLQI